MSVSVKELTRHYRVTARRSISSRCVNQATDKDPLEQFVHRYLAQLLGLEAFGEAVVKSEVNYDNDTVDYEASVYILSESQMQNLLHVARCEALEELKSLTDKLWGE